METNPDIIETNRARLTGELLKDLDFSHRTYGEAFYETLIGVERSSGYRDEIRLQISERLLLGLCLGAGSRVDVRGQVRTYNEETDGRSKLNIVVFAREISEIPEDEQLFYENEIYLDGHICKTPIRRTSPLGREICDIMLAVNRMYNKSDYIPCIAWGRNASLAAAV